MAENLSDKAREIMDQLWGNRAERELMPAERLAPEFFDLASASCFGGFWSRRELDIRSRSLCTVAQLAALGRSNELKIRKLLNDSKELRGYFRDLHGHLQTTYQ